MRPFHLVAAAVAFALAPIGALAGDLTEDRVRELVLETIRENPEIVLEAVAILEQRQAEAQADAQAEVLSSQRLLLERDPNAPVLGNPEGDVTVVEFFDYNCPYCRRVKPEVRAMIEADPNIRLVYREWPILGDGSVFAAKAALAAREQGKYEEFHWAMMGLKGRANEASVLRVAEEIGLDLEALRRDMEAPGVQEHIDTSMRLTQALGFNGTPSFVIGDNLVAGFVERAELEKLVAEARGEGSAAFLFAEDSCAFALRLHTEYLDDLGTNAGHLGEVSFTFYGRDGRMLGRETRAVPGGISSHGFQTDDGVARIAGVLVENLDPGGIALDDIRFGCIPRLG